VSTLVGLRSFDYSVKCLKSMVSGLGVDVLTIHLDSDDALNSWIQVEASLGCKVEFVCRRNADIIVNNYLEKYPNCRGFRDGNVLALKVFDLLLMSRDETVLYLDSDIYFNYKVSIPQNMFGYPCVFMRDLRSSYTLRPWHFPFFKGERIPSKINTGFILAKKQILNLDYVEWLLEWLKHKEVARKRPYWLEQTIFAFLSGKSNDCQLIGSPCFGFPTKYSNLDDIEKFSAIHFVSTFRDKLNLVSSFPAQEQQMVWFSFKSKLLTPVELFWDDFTRRYS
jgi:hypothetical protein